MIVTGIAIFSFFVRELGRLSVMMTCVMPTLYPANPSGFAASLATQVRTRVYGLAALCLCQNCMLPLCGFLFVGMVVSDRVICRGLFLFSKRFPDGVPLVDDVFQVGMSD